VAAMIAALLGAGLLAAPTLELHPLHSLVAALPRARDEGGPMERTSSRPILAVAGSEYS